MQLREFLTIAIFLETALSPLIKSTAANTANPTTRESNKVTLNLGDLLIEVTPPRGRESIVNAGAVYEKWESVDDVAYWESIYGSMDDIPAFEDLPEIAGETVVLENVRETDEETFNADEQPSLAKLMEESSRTVETRTDETASSSDRCERTNPLYRPREWSSRPKREASPRRQFKTDDSKRKPRTSRLNGESGRSRRKSALHTTRRADYVFNRSGRRNHRSRYSELETGVDRAKLPSFVDAAVSAEELGRFETDDQGQVVEDGIANEAMQLGRAKHEAIDLDAGPATELESLNNAATACNEDELNAAVANIHSGVEVVGNSVVETNCGMVNAATTSADETDASAATETVGGAIDTVGTLANNGIDEAEIETPKANPDAAPKSDSKVDVADEEENEAVEAGVEILGKEAIAGDNEEEVLDEEPVEERITGEDAVKRAGAELEEKNDAEIAPEVEAELPPTVEDSPPDSVAFETVANDEKSEADEIVGSSLNVNSADGKTSPDAEASAETETRLVGKKHHRGKAGHNFGDEDLSCECFESLGELRRNEYHHRRHHNEDQEFEDQRFPGHHRQDSYRRDHQRTHHSGLRADSGFRNSFDEGIDRNSNHFSKSLNAEALSSLDLHSNLDIGRSRDSGLHADSVVHANTGLHVSLDTGIDLNSNHGSKSHHASSASSLGLHSNLDIESSSNSGLSSRSGIRESPGATLDIDSVRRATHRAGAKSSLDLDSGLDDDRGKTRLQESLYDDDYESDEDSYGFEGSDEKRDHGKGFPGDDLYLEDRVNAGKRRHHGIHATSGIHASLNAGLVANGDGIRSGMHANSGILTSSDAGIHLNTDSSGGHSRTGSGGTLNEADSRYIAPDGNYPSEDGVGFEDASSEYDEYEELEYGRRYPDVSRRDHSFRYDGRKSDPAIRDVGLDFASSMNQESDFHFGSSTLEVGGADSRHPTKAMKPRTSGVGDVYALDDANADGHFRTGVEASLDLDSHLDTAVEAEADVANARSRIRANVNRANGKLGEEICEAACRGMSDSREDRTWPSSRFNDAYDGREYSRRGNSRFAERGEGPYRMCDNCGRRLHGIAESSCPICGRLDDRSHQERRRFSAPGTMYHFDGPKQHFKRTANYESACGYNHHINLDANCTDEATSRTPDCQGMDYDLQTPQDGNPVPLGFVRAHLSHGHDIAVDMHDRARSLVAGGLRPSPHTASMLNLFNNKAPDDLVKLNEESELTLVGTKLLQQKLSVDYNITPNTFVEFLKDHGFRVTGDRICRGRRKRCGGHSKFRSHDGSCNNIDHPTWGQSNRAFARILPARYSDGIHSMPVSVTGAELPNPRKLSVRLYSRSGNRDPELTLAVVQWGQTLAHDLARQVMDQTTKGGIECCGNNGKSQLPKSLQHHSCAPISISPRDKFYSIHGQRCMNFVRAMTVTREDCTLGPADQLNGATSFLDCSPVYGADKTASDELREFAGGRMKVEFRSGRWMLPTMRNRSNFCDIWTSDDVCYRTGDPRNNQNPQLVILQTLLVREHNRIANGLSALNPQWNDERIFQESRRIVIAEYQHITYNEWLPLLLGKRYCKRHGIVRTKHGMSDEYDETVNPSTIIGFTSGAFRSLHSMIDGDIGLCKVDGEIVENLRLSDHYFRPRVIEENNNFEHLLRGLTMQRMQKQNMHLHRELTEYLFRSRNDYGMDLAAIDIQRGRDHGVPGYNAYRKICRLQPARDFDDLSEEMSWENIEKLRRDYAHVDDIDLVVGATMENRVSGSRFGPTNRCLIGEQFYRSRVGDRYFYDNGNSPHSFTPEQFDEITKVTLSRLMCDMGGAVAVVQRHAFRAVSSKNPLVPCEELPKLDLTNWIE